MAIVFVTFLLLFLMRSWTSVLAVQEFAAIALGIIVLWNFLVTISKFDAEDNKILSFLLMWWIFVVSDLPFLLPFFALALIRYWM